MSSIHKYFGAICAIVCIGACLLSGIRTPENLSAQGCRMSYMSPSYILQDAFNETQSPLARRYRLWLYREVGWEHELHGQPVLFIPGHAGSYGQVRSISSSSTRQFFSEPDVPVMVAPVKPADFFTIDLNEDFSALHGPTLAAQRNYATAAVSYILSLYPQGTQVVLLGHSMGGIVATSMLPNRNISALITMATPHTLPPARFDRRIEELYAHNAKVLAYDPTPIVSLCGGATDILVPSESCIIPDHDTRAEGSTRPYRRTVFASALEGAWTGVGHQVIVWCHQVRWRVARAILDLSATTDNSLRAKALDKWLSAEPTLQTRPDLDSAPVALDKGKMVTDTTLRVEHPKSSQTYMFPIPEEPSRFTLLVSSGSVPPIAPQKVGQLTINVLYCSSTKQCTPLRPDTHQLLPRPVIGKAFPTPKEGSDESAGIVLFETSTSSLGDGYIAIRVTSADGTGAFAAGFSPPGIVKVQSRAFGWASVSSGTTLKLSPSLSIHQTFPNLLSHAMLVWRATPVYANAQSCKDSDALLHPLLTLHSPHEAHHYPLHPSFPVPLLHTHAGAPFLTSPTHGLNITIRSSGEPACAVEKLVITLDIWSTMGRWGARLWPAIASSAIGVVALLVFDALAIAESSSGLIPSVGTSLSIFARKRAGPLMIGALVFSLLPLPPSYGLGTSGTATFAPLAPLVILTATGLVIIIWWILRALMLLYGGISAVLSIPYNLVGRSAPYPTVHERRSRRAAILSYSVITLVVFLLVPWQVAFLGCWLLHFQTVASSTPPSHARSRSDPPTNIALSTMSSSSLYPPRPSSPPSSTSNSTSPYNPTHLHQHILLLLTMLLPLAASVLAVWARTLITAGLSTPFDGDHNVLYALPFLLLVDAASWTSTSSTANILLHMHHFEREKLSTRWAFALLAAVCFMFGARKTYLIFEFASIAVGLLVLVRVVPRYVT